VTISPILVQKFLFLAFHSKIRVLFLLCDFLFFFFFSSLFPFFCRVCRLARSFSFCVFQGKSQVNDILTRWGFWIWKRPDSTMVLILNQSKKKGLSSLFAQIDAGLCPGRMVKSSQWKSDLVFYFPFGLFLALVRRVGVCCTIFVLSHIILYQLCFGALMPRLGRKLDITTYFLGSFPRLDVVDKKLCSGRISRGIFLPCFEPAFFFLLWVKTNWTIIWF